MTCSACVNHMLYKSVQRDSVWVRAFKQDSKESLAVVLKNEWVLKKWSLLNPDEKPVENNEKDVKEEEVKVREEVKENGGMKENGGEVKENGTEVLEGTEAGDMKVINNVSEMGEAKEAAE